MEDGRSLETSKQEVLECLVSVGLFCVELGHFGGGCGGQMKEVVRKSLDNRSNKDDSDSFVSEAS